MIVEHRKMLDFRFKHLESVFEIQTLNAHQLMNQVASTKVRQND